MAFKMAGEILDRLIDTILRFNGGNIEGLIASYPEGDDKAEDALLRYYSAMGGHRLVFMGMRGEGTRFHPPEGFKVHTVDNYEVFGPLSTMITADTWVNGEYGGVEFAIVIVPNYYKDTRFNNMTIRTRHGERVI